MDFRPTELQELLQTSARDVLETAVPRDRVRELEAAGAPDPGLWRQIADLGWPGLPVAEQYGGQAGSLMDLSVIIRELCRSAAPTPFVATMLCALAIQRQAPEDLRQRVLPEVVAGRTLAPAFLESGDDLYATPRVRLEGGVLSGEKRFVEYGADADFHLVSALAADGAPGLAVVERAQSGVQVTPLVAIGSIPSCNVLYDHSEVLGWIAGAAAVDGLRDLGGALTAFETYCYVQTALDMTVDYVQMRVQFGQPIGAFQAVQNRVADMAILVEASRFLTHELLWQYERGLAPAGQVALVKAITAQMGPQVAMDCHLLHGGIGYMQEYYLQHYTRRIKDASLRWGTTRETIDQVAQAALAG